MSTSLRDFTVTLLGYFLVDRLRGQGAEEGELAHFLKWEQLAGYVSAHFNHDLQFRGTERVQKSLAEGSRVFLSADRAHQILSNQKIYGLWGLYSVPSRVSGILAPDPIRPSAEAMELIEKAYLPILARGGFGEGDAILELLTQPRAAVYLEGRHRTLCKVIAKLLKRQVLRQAREFYVDHLVYGGLQDPTNGLQRQLANVIAPSLADADFSLSPAALRHWEKSARGRSKEPTALSEALGRIRTCESLLAPASAFFTFTLSFQGSRVDELVRDVRAQWGDGVRTIDPDAINSLSKDFAGASIDGASPRLAMLARSLHRGDYHAALDLLLEQNAAVMKERGSGAPWAEVREGRLEIRFRDETGQLPKRNELPGYWRFSYFLDSLRSVLQQLAVAS